MSRPDPIRAGLIGLGLYELAVGFRVAVDRLPRTSTRDRSRALEQATVGVSVGFASLAAVRRRSWQAPILALGSLTWMLRAFARPAIARRYRQPGPSYAVPAAGAGALAWLFSRAERAERWETG